MATNALSEASTPDIARVVRDYWVAVAHVLERPWSEPRRHVLNKGIGVYALMGMLADLWTEYPGPKHRIERIHLEAALHDLADYDWSSSGPLAGLGGLGGAGRALELLRAARTTACASAQRSYHTEASHA